MVTCREKNPRDESRFCECCTVSPQIEVEAVLVLLLDGMLICNSCFPIDSRVSSWSVQLLSDPVVDLPGYCGGIICAYQYISNFLM